MTNIILTALSHYMAYAYSAIAFIGKLPTGY